MSSICSNFQGLLQEFYQMQKNTHLTTTQFENWVTKAEALILSSAKANLCTQQNTSSFCTQLSNSYDALSLYGDEVFSDIECAYNPNCSSNMTISGVLFGFLSLWLLPLGGLLNCNQ